MSKAIQFPVPEAAPLPGRKCGSCTLCCRLLAVAELDKPQSQACGHCDEESGCRIYKLRPNACRSFHCVFLSHPQMRENWRPSKSHMVLAISSDGRRVAAHVDPKLPGAWRREPYYSTLRTWALAAHARPDQIGQVFVTIGKQTIVLLPDRAVDMGMVEPDEVVITKGNRTAAGISFEVIKVRKDDPFAVAALGSPTA